MDREINLNVYLTILGKTTAHPPENDKQKYVFIVENEQLALNISTNGYLAVPVNDDEIETFIHHLSLMYGHIVKDKDGVYQKDGFFLTDYTLMLASSRTVNKSIAYAMESTFFQENFDPNAWKIFNNNNKNPFYFQQYNNEKEMLEEIEKYISKCEGKANMNNCLCNLTIADNSYMKPSKEGVLIAVSNFIIEPIELVLLNGKGTLHATVKTDSGNYKVSIPDTAISHINKFKAFMSEGFKKLYFKGNEKDFEDVKYLYGKYDYPIRNGVRSTGMLKIKEANKNDDFPTPEYCFVGNDKTIDKNGKEIKDFVFAKQYEVLKTTLLDVEPINAEEFKEISNALFKFNEPAKVLIILGFCCSCFFKESLKESGNKLNHLFLIGEAGSGKSTTIDTIIRPFFGLVNSAFSAKNLTKFSSIKTASSSNTIPFIIDEYKPYQLSTSQVDMILDLIRNIYDGHLALRGKIDQSIEEYPLESPLVLAGEAGSDEPAIVERALILNYSKADITKEMTEALEILKSKSHLLTKLGRLILDVALDNYIGNMVSTCAETYHERYGITSYRLAHAAACCFAGLFHLDYAIHHELKSPELFNLDDAFFIIPDYIKKEMLNDGEEPRTAIEDIIEYMDLIASENPGYEGVYYQIEGDTLYLDIKGLYPLFTEYIQRHNVKGIAVLEQRQFVKQLKSAKKYMIKYDKIKFKNSIRKRAYYLNLKEVEKLDTRVFRISNTPDYPNTKDNPFEPVE